MDYRSIHDSANSTVFFLFMAESREISVFQKAEFLYITTVLSYFS